MSLYKRTFGQYFTAKDIWLRNHIKEFILSTNTKIVFDPFAGNGDLLTVSLDLGFQDIIGFDIDRKLNWEYNDSLLDIPYFENSIIITNPPYLTNYSAKRKGILDDVNKYYDSGYDDLYKLALDKMLKKNKSIVAIVPETFINSDFPKNRLNSITILEDNPFKDTENPVCVVCFDDMTKDLSQVKVYKNDLFLDNLKHFYDLRLKPQNALKIKFNDINGQVALRAIDTTTPTKKIKFMKKEELNYNMKGIKESSRLITIINIFDEIKDIDDYVESCNIFLDDYREKTQDVLFSPFKGNNKSGERRRRLDYASARAIMEFVYVNMYSNTSQLFLNY